MFLSQTPHLPLGDLRAVLSYPRTESAIPDGDLVAALDAVTLGHLGGRLDEDQDWAKVLSRASSNVSPSPACCCRSRR